MVNAEQPSPPKDRRPRFSRIVLRLALLGSLLLGAGLLWSAFSTGPAAAAYRQAVACETASVASANCYQLVSATVGEVLYGAGKGTRRAFVYLLMPGRGQSVNLPGVTIGEEAVLHRGATATAQIYRGDITVVTVDNMKMPTDKNPLDQQSRGWWVGSIALGVGGIGLLADFRPRLRVPHL